ncbi:MAG: uncharacterized protein K0S65_1714 [Labilithrix sp.]|nr:uncharacterized protein [Labilithrix sp.]
MSIEVSDIATPELVSETGTSGDRIEVRFVGSAEAVTSDDLKTYLGAIHRAALSSRAAEVVLDLRALEFMSAACLRSMLAWVSDLKERPQYLARLVSDARKPWQGRTLQGLATFGGDLVQLVHL